MFVLIRKALVILLSVFWGWFPAPLLAGTANASSNIVVLSDNDRVILDAFFRILLQDSQGGYVLYGNKPVCMEGVLPGIGNVLILGEANHRQSVVLREGYQVWKRLFDFVEDPPFIICISDVPNNSGWYEFYLVNRSAFIRTVKEHQVLFKYILGPNATPENLWNVLKEHKESLSSVFRDDRVLIGIVLGYGVENALSGSRCELLDEYLIRAEEKVPYKSISTRAELPPKKRGKESLYKNLDGDPSFGYNSIKAEQKGLKEKSVISKNQVRCSKPQIPWFACYDTLETERLIKEYAQEQETIAGVLNTEQFLEKICEKLHVDISSASTDTFGFDLNFSPQLSTWIAQELWQGLSEHSYKYVDSFIKGMLSSDQENECTLVSEQLYKLLDEVQDSQKILQEKQNLMEANNFLLALNGQKDCICVEPGMIYYRQSRQGIGPKVLKGRSQVVLNYTVLTGSGDILSLGKKESLDLSEIIPGLALGIMGMKLEEIREVYIHPQWAYGKRGNIDPNILLIVKVELLEIGPSHNRVEVAMTPIEVSSSDLSISELQEKIEALRLQVAFQLGIKSWNHLKGGKIWYHLADVTAALLRAQKGETVDLTVEEVRNSLSHLHWVLYQNDDRSQIQEKVSG